MNAETLREYQKRAIDMLYSWFASHETGNPCLEMPTGSGKSHVIAALCKDAIQSWPETRILMLTHVKELIEQNYAQLLKHWPDAPVGIYSASIGQKQLGEPITFAGIQSVRDRADKIGHTDIVIVDEAHLISHKDHGGYRKLIEKLKAINPALRVIGLTATPYRLGHGLITDEPAIFKEIISPISVYELVAKGFLAPLHSKTTSRFIDISGVHTRGGEYVESELQFAMDKDAITGPAVDEIIQRAGGRKAWLIFCAGVRHAENVAAELQSKGIEAECVTGDMPMRERDETIRRFKSGELRCLTNANVLTTGFDYPDIDLIAFLRPTLSPGLYVQMAGRGMRIKSHTDHCLVLDFVGNVARHGPITAVVPPSKPGKSTSGAPTKTCPECAEILAASATICTSCGHEFPRKPVEMTLRNDDIMGMSSLEMAVTGWAWRYQISQSSGNPMLSCTYYGGLTEKPVREYHVIWHEGYAGEKARAALAYIIAQSGGQYVDFAGEDVPGEELASRLTDCRPPDSIEYKIDGKFHRVLSRAWNEQETQRA